MRIVIAGFNKEENGQRRGTTRTIGVEFDEEAGVIKLYGIDIAPLSEHHFLDVPLSEQQAWQLEGLLTRARERAKWANTEWALLDHTTFSKTHIQTKTTATPVSPALCGRTAGKYGDGAPILWILRPMTSSLHEDWGESVCQNCLKIARERAARTAPPGTEQRKEER